MHRLPFFQETFLKNLDLSQVASLSVFALARHAREEAFQKYLHLVKPDVLLALLTKLPKDVVKEVAAHEDVLKRLSDQQGRLKKEKNGNAKEVVPCSFHHFFKRLLYFTNRVDFFTLTHIINFNNLLF